MQKLNEELSTKDDLIKNLNLSKSKIEDTLKEKDANIDTFKTDIE